MAVIAIHSVLAGPTIKTGVTLTVIDDGITGFAWVHKTTQMKMDERRMTQANGEAKGEVEERGGGGAREEKENRKRE